MQAPVADRDKLHYINFVMTTSTSTIRLEMMGMMRPLRAEVLT
jgi:hypothetical protein